MSKTDFQNGFALGMASGGVVEVVDTTEIDALETLIDESGVLEDTEGSVNEKVEGLIDLAEQSAMYYALSKNLSISDATGLATIGYQYKTIPKIDFSNKTRLAYAFSGSNIEYIDYYINSSNCTNFSDAFSVTKKLKWIVGVDLSSAISIYDLFVGSNIETIQEPLNIAKVTDARVAFNNVAYLKNIQFVKECIKTSIGIYSEVLTKESVDSIVDGLAYVDTAKTLSFFKSLETKGVLTDAHKSTILEKGWTLVI